jgi:hypothetical protein
LRKELRVSSAETLLQTPLAGLEPAAEGGLPSSKAARGRDALFPGYRFLARQRHGPLGEVWTAVSPDGRKRLLTFLSAHAGGDPAKTGAALDRLQAVVHEAVPPFARLRAADGRFVLASSPPDKTLQDRFRECWSRNLPGIPRDELVPYLAQAAVDLDDLARRYDLCHLALHPDRLQLHNGQVRLGDFGLVELLARPGGQPLAQSSPRYAAPELFNGRFHEASDQYSLALIYAELLTGVHPCVSSTGQRTDLAGDGQPNLRLLSSRDAAAVGKALRRDPARRFRNCADLAQALGATSAGRGEIELPTPLAAVIVAPSEGVVAVPGDPLPSLYRVVSELVATVAGAQEVQQPGRARYLLKPGQCLEHNCIVSLFPGGLTLRLESFRQQWHAQVTRRAPTLCALAVELPIRLWHRLVGRRTGLEVQVLVLRSAGGAARLSEIAVQIKPFGCDGLQAERLLAEMGPVLLESLRGSLQAHPDQRSEQRWQCEQVLRVCPVLEGVRLAEPIDGQGKDISRHGIGFVLPRELPSDQVYVTLPPTTAAGPVAVLARVVRGRVRRDGRFEAGASFGNGEPG